MVVGESILPTQARTMISTRPVSGEGTSITPLQNLNQSWVYLDNLLKQQRAEQDAYNNKTNTVPGFQNDFKASFVDRNDADYQRFVADAQRKQNEYNTTHNPATGGAGETFTAGGRQYQLDLLSSRYAAQSALNKMNSASNPTEFQNAQRAYNAAKQQYTSLNSMPMSDVQSKYQDKTENIVVRAPTYAAGWGPGGKLQDNGLSKIENEQRALSAQQTQAQMSQMIQRLTSSGQRLTNSQIEDYADSIKNSGGVVGSIPTGLLDQLSNPQSKTMAAPELRYLFPDVPITQEQKTKIERGIETAKSTPTQRDDLFWEQENQKYRENLIGLSSMTHSWALKQDKNTGLNPFDPVGDVSLNLQQNQRGLYGKNLTQLPSQNDYNTLLKANPGSYYLNPTDILPNVPNRNLDQMYTNVAKEGPTGYSPVSRISGNLNILSQKAPFLSTIASSPVEQTPTNDLVGMVLGGIRGAIVQTPRGAMLFGNETEKARGTAQEEKIDRWVNFIGPGLLAGGISNKAPVASKLIVSGAEKAVEAGKAAQIEDILRSTDLIAQKMKNVGAAKNVNVQDVGSLKFGKAGSDTALTPLENIPGTGISKTSGMRFSKAQESSLLPIESTGGIAKTSGMRFNPENKVYGMALKEVPVQDTSKLSFGGQGITAGLKAKPASVLSEEEKVARAIGSTTERATPKPVAKIIQEAEDVGLGSKTKDVWSFLPFVGAGASQRDMLGEANAKIGSLLGFRANAAENQNIPTTQETPNISAELPRPFISRVSSENKDDGIPSYFKINRDNPLLAALNMANPATMPRGIISNTLYRNIPLFSEDAKTFSKGLTSATKEQEALMNVAKQNKWNLNEIPDTEDGRQFKDAVDTSNTKIENIYKSGLDKGIVSKNSDGSYSFKENQMTTGIGRDDKRIGGVLHSIGITDQRVKGVVGILPEGAARNVGTGFMETFTKKPVEVGETIATTAALLPLMGGVLPTAAKSAATTSIGSKIAAQITLPRVLGATWLASSAQNVKSAYDTKGQTGGEKQIGEELAFGAAVLSPFAAAKVPGAVSKVSGKMPKATIAMGENGYMAAIGDYGVVKGPSPKSPGGIRAGAGNLASKNMLLYETGTGFGRVRPTKEGFLFENYGKPATSTKNPNVIDIKPTFYEKFTPERYGLPSPSPKQISAAPKTQSPPSYIPGQEQMTAQELGIAQKYNVGLDDILQLRADTSKYTTPPGYDRPYYYDRFFQEMKSISQAKAQVKTTPKPEPEPFIPQAIVQRPKTKYAEQSQVGDILNEKFKLNPLIGSGQGMTTRPSSLDPFKERYPSPYDTPYSERTLTEWSKPSTGISKKREPQYITKPGIKFNFGISPIGRTSIANIPKTSTPTIPKPTEITPTKRDTDIVEKPGTEIVPGPTPFPENKYDPDIVPYYQWQFKPTGRTPPNYPKPKIPIIPGGFFAPGAGGGGGGGRRGGLQTTILNDLAGLVVAKGSTAQRFSNVFGRGNIKSPNTNLRPQGKGNVRPVQPRFAMPVMKAPAIRAVPIVNVRGKSPKRTSSPPVINMKIFEAGKKKKRGGRAF